VSDLLLVEYKDYLAWSVGDGQSASCPVRPDGRSADHCRGGRGP